MKTLHILKSEPDSEIETLISAISGQDPDKVELYKDNADWHKVVDQIFAYDKVICWW